MKLYIHQIAGTFDLHVYGKCGYLIDIITVSGKIDPSGRPYERNYPNIDGAAVKNITAVCREKFLNVDPLIRWEMAND